MAFLAIAQNLPAQGTAFTYQGQLQSNGGPANGNYDFTFALFSTNTVASGLEVGGVLTNLDVCVTNGLFTTTLDFGPVFTGSATWLAIGVRTIGGASFTVLGQLQALTPTPYAIYASTAASADAVAGSNIVGAIPAAALPPSVLTNATSAISGTNYITSSYAANGTYPITVPAGANQMVVKLWGAGAEGSGDTDGGGGAFSQVTLEVTPGDAYVIVVGQSGGNGGGAGANNGSGGARVSPGGTGGQASSLFKFTGTAYLMKAVAGGGGGGGGTSGNGFGGNAGQPGGSGSGYAANATTTGVASLDLIGGDGASGINNGQEGGGAGGGYGGGTINEDGQANGGGSYGDVTTGGSFNVPGNTSDPNYVPPSATGGNFPYGGGGDGLAVVIFTQPFVEPPPAVTLTTPLQAPALNTGSAVVGGITTNAIAPLTVAPNVPGSPIGSLNYTLINSLAVAGRYVYAVGNGLQIYDVSVPSAPGVAGFLPSTASQTSIAVAGRYAYVASGGLQVIDVGNPANPVQVGAAGTVGAASVAVAGRYAYVANNASNLLQVIDISKPAAPVIVGQAATTGTANSVAVAGRYAYVTEGNAGGGGAFQVFDVGSPTVPVAAGSASLYYGAGIAVSGPCAYVGAGNAFTIFEVTNAALPKSVATSTTPGFYQNSIAVAGRYAFVGGQANGSVYMWDVSTPASPVLVGLLSASGVNAVAVSGRYLYAGNGTGLTIFDLGGAYVQSLEAGTVEVGSLQTRDTASIGNNLNVRGGLNTGGSALITGGLSVSGTGIAPTSYALYVNGTVAGTSAYINASDERYKTNITGLDHALDKVMALRGVAYDWRRTAYPQMNFDDGRQIGFLAQEVKEVLPEAVSQDANGYYGIAYSKVIPLLVEAIKDQQKEMAGKNAAIEQLEAKSSTVDALEKQNDSLTRRVNELAAAVNALTAKQ